MARDDKPLHLRTIRIMLLLKVNGAILVVPSISSKMRSSGGKILQPSAGCKPRFWGTGRFFLKLPGADADNRASPPPGRGGREAPPDVKHLEENRCPCRRE